MMTAVHKDLDARTVGRCVGRLALIGALMGGAGQVAAQDNQRLIVDLVTRVQALERELRALRGEVEQQDYTLNQLRDQQKQQYLDLEGRLNGIEQNGGSLGPGGGALSSSNNSGNLRDLSITGEPQAAVSSEPDTPSQADATQEPVGGDAVNEQAAYESAFELLKAGRYADASQVLSQFLQDYPDGQLAPNARYWLAESYYVSSQLEPSLQEFDRFVREYPTNEKLAQALLKIGYIYDRMGITEDARNALSEVATRFPDSAAARLAKKRLERLGSQ